MQQLTHHTRLLSFACATALLSALLTGCNDDSTDIQNTDVTENTAPVANAGADQLVLVNATVTLSGAQSTDAESDTLIYLWSITSTPAGSTTSLSDVSTISPSFLADTAGTYTFALVVDDGAASSELDSIEVSVTEQTTATTDGILCDYDYSEFNDSASVQYLSSAQWTCENGSRSLSTNGIPDHAVGTFPNEGNPNTISAQTVSEEYVLAPVESAAVSELGGPRGATGYVLNGVKIDASTAGSCDDSGNNCSLIDNSGSWNIEALGHSSFDFGTDDNNAHVQPGGTYHYHGMSEGFISLQGGNSSIMTIIAWAADGFPIYARYGYSEANNLRQIWL